MSETICDQNQLTPFLVHTTCEEPQGQSNSQHYREDSTYIQLKEMSELVGTKNAEYLIMGFGVWGHTVSLLNRLTVPNIESLGRGEVIASSLSWSKAMLDIVRLGQIVANFQANRLPENQYRQEEKQQIDVILNELNWRTRETPLVLEEGKVETDPLLTDLYRSEEKLCQTLFRFGTKCENPFFYIRRALVGLPTERYKEGVSVPNFASVQIDDYRQALRHLNIESLLWPSHQRDPNKLESQINTVWLFCEDNLIDKPVNLIVGLFHCNTPNSFLEAWHLMSTGKVDITSLPGDTEEKRESYYTSLFTRLAVQILQYSQTKEYWWLDDKVPEEIWPTIMSRSIDYHSFRYIKEIFKLTDQWPKYYQDILTHFLTLPEGQDPLYKAEYFLSQLTKDLPGDLILQASKDRQTILDAMVGLSSKQTPQGVLTSLNF